MADADATGALAMGRGATARLESIPDHEAAVIDGTGPAQETTGFSAYRLARTVAR